MTRILFDPDFDGGSWPGPLASCDAVAGEAWLGARGLLDRLETVLGVAGLTPTPGERAAALVPGLRAQEGFWSRSAAVDPLGSARELLRWRDELAMAGWRGRVDGVPERVASLARLAGNILPGIPDRVWRVADVLNGRSADVEELRLLEPLACLPSAWRRVVEGLRTQGTSIIEVALDPVAAAGDLAGARDSGFRPEGDGSVQLIRSDGPWAAAVEVAAWLASRESTDRVVVVTPTPLLDTELRRFGLPTTGARQVGGGSSVLEVLPLVLALGWKPAAPDDAAALLSLPESPVPRGIRNRLRRALREWPAVGSGVWEAAFEHGLDAIEDAERRTRVRERLRGIFEGTVDRSGPGYPVAELRRRIALVREWLRSRRASLNEDATTDFEGALEEAYAQCLAFERIVGLAALDRWGGADLQRFLDEARSSLSPEPVLPAEAGVASVSSPGAVAGPARCIVWWDFTRRSAPGYPRLPFIQSERAQLVECGVELPSPAERAVRQALRWRRPLDQASEALLLVSPRTDESGAESHPHPLWDEIEARIDPTAGTHNTFVSGSLYAIPRAAVQVQPLRPPPPPLRAWNVNPELLKVPERASHAAVEDLLRCPMRWALGRLAKLHPADEIEVEVSNRVLGRLAHALLEAVLPAAKGDPDVARQLAGEWFDSRAPTLVAALFLPGREADSARVRRILVDGAEMFTEFVRDTHRELRLTEVELEGRGLGQTLFGIPDLVLGPKPLVVDAKWGGFGYRRRALENGTATQLAFYAHLLGQQPDFDRGAAAVAFFVLERGRILTTQAEPGGRAETVSGPSHIDTWLALERAFDARSAELRRGVLLATANPDDLGEGVPTDDSVGVDGAVILAPKCQWCHYGGLCGATLGEIRR